MASNGPRSTRNSEKSRNEGLISINMYAVRKRPAEADNVADKALDFTNKKSKEAFLSQFKTANLTSPTPTLTATTSEDDLFQLGGLTDELLNEWLEFDSRKNKP